MYPPFSRYSVCPFTINFVTSDMRMYAANDIPLHFQVDLMVREEHADANWVTVPRNTTQAFWPEHLSSTRHVCVKVAGTEEYTTVFAYGTLQTILLRLRNKYGGIYVQTQVSDSSATCSFSLYKPGTASALLINDTKHNIKFRQVVDVGGV